jgi:hypothetical protein
MQPADTPAASWDEDEVLAGYLPWQPTNLAARATKEALELALHKANAELDRTCEELVFFEQDPHHLLEYYAYQERVLLRRAWSLSLAGGIPDGVAFILKRKLDQLRAVVAHAQKVFAKAGLVKVLSADGVPPNS